MALASKVKIEIDGKEAKDFLHLTINQHVYGFNKFEISFRLDTFESIDGFVLNNTKLFIGATVVISIAVSQKGDGTALDTFIFKGIITNVRGLKSGLSQTNQVILIGESPEILLNDIPGSRSFENKNLKQIVDEVLKPFPRDILKSKVNPSTKVQFEYVVQHNENNYEFLRRLATRHGEWMFFDGTEFVFGALSSVKSNLILGLNQSEFNFGIKLNPLNFNYKFYDYYKNTVFENPSTKSLGKKQLNEIGQLAYDKSAKYYAYQAQSYYSHLNVHQGSYTKQLKEVAELKEKAKAVGMSTVEGTSQNPGVTLGGKVNIKALKVDKKGKVDYGEYIVTSLTHTCDNLMNYSNHFKGISAEATVPEYTNPLAIATCNPQNAIVMDNNDPEKLGRVRVNFFWQEKNQMSPWIRAVNPYSADDGGFYFIPELGDEVLIDFVGGDAEKPYVIGSLNHGNNKPHSAWPNSKNSFKGIVTKGNLRLEFDEENKRTTIDTPGGNKIVISDDKKSILLLDENMNRVELSPDGIVLDSPKDISIKSQAKISIDALKGIELTSTAGDVNASGLNISQKASIDFKAEGLASAELKNALASLKGDSTGATVNGGPMTTIQGILVKIN